MASQPGLTPTRLARVREIFDAALDREPDERELYLSKACGDDPSLAAEVRSLLAVLERNGETSWESPFGELLSSAFDGESGVDRAGERIGHYEITRLIGFGGMGAVYEGVRADDQYQKRVAIKFLRQGLEGDLAIRRFRYERQILASLNHPNVASLLDGGVTADGRPYFVMEYVDGEPITKYCARLQLGVRERIRLLQQVFAAVQHAHQNLVVHRDLKPGNILVDASGTVKLLDFGIARLLRESEGPDQLPLTHGGARALTPDYASPEQLRGQSVATASDIYALGVICSELLSGHRPFRLDGLLFSEMQDVVCLTPAPAPSTLVTDSDAPAFGERRARRLKALLAGDVDAIVLQALRKEPGRRYASVDQMGADFQRHLDGMPVSAHRDGLGYRLGKFVRRRRVEVTAGMLVLVSLLGGVVVSTRQARRAELERAKMEQVNSFLATMLAAADPGNEGRDVTVAQMLSQAAHDVELASLEPEVEGQVRHTIAQTYVGLGLYDSATVHANRAYELRRAVLGPLHRRTLMSHSYVVALAEYRGDFEEAVRLARLQVDYQRRARPLNPSDLATSLDNLARNLTHIGELDEAMEVQQESVEIRRRSDDPESREALPLTLANVAVAYTYRGDFERAEALAREALGVEEEVNGSDSHMYGNLLRGHASALSELDRLEEAESAARQSLEVLAARAGRDHPDYVRSSNVLASIRFSAGDMPGTVEAARTVVDAIGVSVHESDPSVGSALQMLGLALDSLGMYAAGDSALRRSLQIRRTYLPEGHWAIASAESMVGYHLGLVGEYAEAERIMTDAYFRMADARGEDAAVVRRLAGRIADLMERIGRRADAESWRSRS